jgi:CheY-like chemotaxis protein
MSLSILVEAPQTCEAETFVTMAMKRVLIIDDEADVRAVVRGCLEDIAGWEVMTADSGKDGLAKVISESPDAILLDVMMPGMDGLAFLSALRNYTKEASLPVVLLTAKMSVTESDDLPGLNVRGVIAKPFDPFLLVEQFANILGWEVES